MNKLIFLFSFCSFLHVSGQELKNDSIQTDQSYTDFKNELILRTFIGIKNLDYFQKNNLLFDNDMITDYDTPTTLDFGVGIHTDFFGWHFWFTTGKVLEEDPMDDKRKLLDIQANFYNQRLSYDINFQNYKGLFAVNEGSNQLAYRPNSHVMHLGGNLLYTLNKDFCLPSSFTQVSKQNQSQGTAILFSGLSHTNLYFPQETDYQRRRFNSISIGGGYSYNFVYKSLFINTMLALAPAIQHQKLDQTTMYALGLHGNFRFGVGYNGERVIYGVTFVDDSQLFSFKENYDRIDKYHFKFFVGYRFHYDWKKHKLTAFLVD